ncbi:uncharacterized protein LOC143860920 [Tasmannia lanceolata]|uniref:uncharacterized protein LOC143860920 n=1 Tax=Tasmannia lanceolata TaxID=3420 RepID=UPI004062F63A
MKTPSHSSNSMKIKTLFQSHIFKHLCHVFRAITKAKSVVIYLLNKNKIIYHKDKKKLYGSFRLHYNWSSSHVLPTPESINHRLDASQVYYDSTWNSAISMEYGGEDDMEPPISRYPHWLEEKVLENPTADVDADEIDQLADMFIASCHEKFRLEKQESYRMYQEMLARSM